MTNDIELAEKMAKMATETGRPGYLRDCLVYHAILLATLTEHTPAYKLARIRNRSSRFWCELHGCNQS